MHWWIDIGSLAALWMGLTLMAYLYLGYPLVIWLRANWAPRPIMRTPACPAVTIVVVAFNEQVRVEPRLDNLLALDYPRDRLEIICASDGSTDETLERARRYRSATV